MNFPAFDPMNHHMNHELTQLIQQKIASKGGALSFAEFMKLALYTPKLGYYAAYLPKFGRQGDFVTAPLLSPFFARTIATQCQAVLSTLTAPRILEIGAGSGIFAAELLLSLESLHSLPETYYIHDISEALIVHQKTTLEALCPHHLSRVKWIKDLNDLSLSGIIIANEVADALPVHCFQASQEQLLERCVVWEKDHFAWKLNPPTSRLLCRQLHELQETYEFPEGYASEINLALPQWIKTLGSLLQTGLILLFDYGYGEREYYHPERREGTLMCYYQHHKHSNPFIHIGLQDITAHVNFTALVTAAMDAGCSLAGFTTQASFLLNSGILELLALCPLSDIERTKQNQAVKTLLMPSRMGEAVKTVGLVKNISTQLKGFSLHDRSRDL